MKPKKEINASISEHYDANTNNKESKAVYNVSKIKTNKGANNCKNEMYIFSEKDFKFSFINSNSINNLGYSFEELLSMTPIDIEPEYSHNDFKTIISPLQQRKTESIKFKTTHLRKDKTTYPVEVNLTKFTIENSSHFMAIVVDLTECKRRESELQKAKEKTEKTEKEFKELFEKSGDAILIIENGIFTECNQAAINILGYQNKKEILDMHPSKLSPKFQPDGQKSLLKSEEMMNISLRNITHRFEWLHTKSNGENIPVEVLLTAIKNELNNKTIHCVWRDITNRKIADLKIKKREKQLRKAHEIAKLGTFIFDVESGLFETSELLNEIVGIDVGREKSLQELSKFSVLEDYKGIIDFLTDDSKKEISIEYGGVRPIDKKEIQVFGNAKKEFNDEGALTKISGTVQDITERKLTEKRLSRADSILSKLSPLVVVSDYDGNVNYVAPSVKEVLGFEIEEVMGNAWWELTFPDSKAGRERLKFIEKDINNKVTKTDDGNLRKVKTKDGSHKWINWYISKDTDNTFIAIGVDVTEKYEKDAQLNTVIQSTNDAIILTNEDGKIIEWNEAAIKVFGYKKNEILGKPFTKLIVKKYRNKALSHFKNINSEDFLSNYKAATAWALRKDGKAFPAEMSIKYWIKDSNYYYCGFLKDKTKSFHRRSVRNITYDIVKYAQESPKLEDLLQFIKDSLHKVIDTSNFFVALCDDNKDYFTVPFRAETELEEESELYERFPKKNSLSGYVVDTKKPFLFSENIESLIDNEIIKEVVGVPCKSWVGVPLICENKAIGVMVVQSYINEDAYTEEDVNLFELVASNVSKVIKQARDFEEINLLNQALIQTPAIVMITDKFGRLEYVNPSFTSITGYTSDEVIGKNPKFLNTDTSIKKSCSIIFDTISKGKSWKGELINIKKDGSKIDVWASIAPVRNYKGDDSHYVIVEEDITEKHKLERQFINAFIEAQEIEKQAFGEELHDGISQILSSESMYIDILIRQNQDRLEDKAKFLTKIKELNLSAINEARSIAHGLMSNQLKQSGLINSIQNICIDFSSTKNAHFEFKNKNVKEDELSKQIKINIFRVIQELTTNINRYSGATKALVEMRKIDRYNLRLIVKDNGIGMDYAKVKEEQKGTGIQNVERRISFLNGTVTIDSAPGKGTHYEIFVPL